jgi:hypothetical protein
MAPRGGEREDLIRGNPRGYLQTTNFRVTFFEEFLALLSLSVSPINLC